MRIQRRNFLKAGFAGSALAALPRLAGAADGAVAFNPVPGAWRGFEVTTKIELAKPDGASQAWVPLPSMAAADWIRPMGDQWKVTDGTATAHHVGHYGAKILHVEWSKDATAPSVEIVSHVATRDRSVDLTRPGKPKPLSAAERKLFTAPTRFIPTDGIVKATADRIVGGATDDAQKARLIYEWVVVNTFRNPKTPGCGLGDISFMLKTGNLGGKCADLNALYVGLARASGLPARDLYGIRVAPSKFGYKSLGANAELITKAQHCRAEVYLSKWGWVPVDPADVRKVVLEEPPGNLALGDPKVEAAHKTLFGAWETNWIAYNQAHDVVLPGSKQGPIGFLMYPQAETPAGRRDCLDADAFKYSIKTKEIDI
jgi:transglutaminase-like putative cysteine protease